MQQRFTGRVILMTLLSLSGACAAAPPPLRSLESTAEEAYDNALAGEPITEDAEEMARAWRDYRPKAEAAGANAELLRKVDGALEVLRVTAASRSDSFRLARAANGVSEPMGALLALHSSVTPAAVTDLDYLCRELELDARASDFARSAADLSRLEETWTALRPRVMRTEDGPDVAPHVDDFVRRVRDAFERRDAEGAKRAAQEGLDLVDELEDVFE